MRRFTWMLLGALVLTGLITSFLIGNNTSTQAQTIFATNTPRPVDVLNVMPQAPVEQYALRLWTENELLDVIVSQLARLSNGEENQARAIRLSLYELELRYPGAPTAMDRRASLVGALLGAPRGSVDVSGVARPYIVEQVNAAGLTTGMETLAGFSVEVMPLNFNGDAVLDALLHVVYPAGAEDFAAVRYEDYIPVLGNADGGYTLLPITPNLPAAPYPNVQNLTLVRAGDLNLDSRDEFALGVDTGTTNKELFIYGFRNDTFTSFVDPNRRLAYGDIRTWDETSADLTITALNLESAKWDCVGEEPVTWVWENNFYRATVALNTEFVPVSSVGCRMLALEPLYVQEWSEVIPIITQILDAPTLDSRGTDRARMALAMLLLLDGDDERAERQATVLAGSAGSNDWLGPQLNAFTVEASNPNTQPIQVCAALERAALQILEDEALAACDVDQVLAKRFVDMPVPRADDLTTTLEEMGLPVLDVVTISRPGFAPREVVNFALAGASWWSFAPTDPEFYVPIITEPPAGFEDQTFAFGPVGPSEAVYTTLLDDRNPAAALSILDNLAAQNPDVPLSIEAQYVQALIYDLLSDRDRAKAAYFSVWESGSSTWASLAGVHLELRGN